MSVESFDPGAPAPQLSEAALERLVAVSTDFLEGGSDSSPVEAEYGANFADNCGLTALERSSMAGLMTAPAKDWQTAAEPLNDDQIESLIRFLTLAEEGIGGWQAGDKSPVIALVKLLKRRGSYSSSVTRWIKANSSNRFLPHGSLMDRL